MPVTVIFTKVASFLEPPHIYAVCTNVVLSFGNMYRVVALYSKNTAVMLRVITQLHGGKLFRREEINYNL